MTRCPCRPGCPHYLPCRPDDPLYQTVLDPGARGNEYMMHRKAPLLLGAHDDRWDATSAAWQELIDAEGEKWRQRNLSSAPSTKWTATELLAQLNRGVK